MKDVFHGRAFFRHFPVRRRKVFMYLPYEFGDPHGVSDEWSLFGKTGGRAKDAQKISFGRPPVMPPERMVDEDDGVGSFETAQVIIYRSSRTISRR
jgi:hypothetical protein